MNLIFKKLRDPGNEFDNYDIEMTSEATTLPEILENFTDFLRGCGFHFSGNLDVVEYDTNSQSIE